MQRARCLPAIELLEKHTQVIELDGETDYRLQLLQEAGTYLTPPGEDSESKLAHYFEEIASGAAYEGRRDLGNTQPGDGVRYKGRGPIQLTGRNNYRAAGQALGLPLEQNPTLASRPDVGFRIAGWFWKTRGLNALADQGAFTTISERINGGHNGLADRYAYWARARGVLG